MAEDTLRFESDAGTNYLVIRIPEARVEDVERLDLRVDGVGVAGPEAAGRVRWSTPPDASGLVMAKWMMPISSTC